MKERRVALRKTVEPIEITGFTSLDHLTLIARFGHIVDASSTGFRVHVRREDLVPKNLRENLTLQSIEGDRVILEIKPMGIEISGRITRTKLLGQKGYEIAIDYSQDDPEYWRECLMDLLPNPGEFD